MHNYLGRISKFLFSNKLTVVLMLAFAVSMGYATFVENDYGTATARALIYDAWWFELLLFGLGLNFAGNIFRYQLLRKEKLALLTFHLAFIIILLGALVTRYTGLEGLIRIREGKQSNILISQGQYLQVSYELDGVQKYFEKPMFASALTPPEFRINIGSTNQPIWIESVDYIPDAEMTLSPGKAGEEVLHLVTANAEGRKDHYLVSGDRVSRDHFTVAFDQTEPDAINISRKGDDYVLQSPYPLDFMIMNTRQAGSIPPDSVSVLEMSTLYQTGGFSFVVADIQAGQTIGYRTTTDTEAAKVAPDVIKVKLEHDDHQKQLMLKSYEGLLEPTTEVTLGALSLNLRMGPKPIELPFSIHLDDFQLERYPGSTSPSSYASEITVIDGDSQLPYRIFMNNVLDYGGYRFFQASYDLDELGTVLSVNRDWWGTLLTYLGYLLMGVGMILSLFGKGSRFQLVNTRLKALRAPAVVLVFTLSTSIPVPGLAQQPGEPREIIRNSVSSTVDLDQLLPIQRVDKEHAAQFGRLLVQDLDGRIKPINTLASEFLRKVSRKWRFEWFGDSVQVQMDCNQLFLSLHADPLAWQYIPLIKVDEKKGADIFHLLDIPTRSHLSFMEFLEDNGDYKLSGWVEQANRKKPAERSQFEDELLKVDERFNIMFQALSGGYLKIFPQPNDPNNTWFTAQFQRAGFSPEDSVFVTSIIPQYFHSVQQARTGDSWKEPQEYLAYIQTFQEVLGKEVSPTNSQVKAELYYNDINLFNRLFPLFWVLGLFQLTLALLVVFMEKRPWLSILQKVGYAGILIGFLLLTANMILRWYAGGYPPWSNGYEMIILVSWAVMLFGFLFHSRTDFILPLSALFTGTLLFVSFLDWLNPEITNLVPVLKSYWLKIHVAIIVSSYAPLALSALLGFLALWLMIVRGITANQELGVTIKELTYLNEMSMTIGLFMLAIGTFLGGVWANESWGRYWGWDPKETWALVSIMVYAVVLHLRLIPSLRSTYLFSLASVLAFSSIVMTSFGVNYYLAGLHSYAKGDPVPIPTFVYWIIGIVFVTALASYTNREKETT